MDQNGPFWPEEVHFGPFRSANRTLAIPDSTCLDFQKNKKAHKLLTHKLFWRPSCLGLSQGQTGFVLGQTGLALCK